MKMNENREDIYRIKELYVGYLGVVKYLGEKKGSEWIPKCVDPYNIVYENSDGSLLDVISGKKYYYWKNHRIDDDFVKEIDGQTVVGQKQSLSLYFAGEFISSLELKKVLSDFNKIVNGSKEKTSKVRTK